MLLRDVPQDVAASPRFKKGKCRFPKAMSQLLAIVTQEVAVKMAQRSNKISDRHFGFGCP
jgi:hypothetical protein